MKAHVYVTLKRTVLDAQGQTVADALRRMIARDVLANPVIEEFTYRIEA